MSRLLAAVAAGTSGEGIIENVTEQLYNKCAAQLISTAIGSGKTESIDLVVMVRDHACQGEEKRHSHDYLWLLEAVTKANHECLQHLIKHHGLPINCQTADSGLSVLHRSAQREDLATMACLIRLGANPLIKNLMDRTPLQLLALKAFPQCAFPANSDRAAQPFPFDVSSYFNSQALSDVILVSDNGQRFFAHRLVLCVQSPVFKALLDSDLWGDALKKEVTLPNVSGRVLQHLLQYLYTGECRFPRDDLNLAIELIAVADQYLLQPMTSQCERVLSDKIDAEVVVPLYYTAFRFNTPSLLANCCHFLLMNYDQVADEVHTTLLHILDNNPLEVAS